MDPLILGASIWALKSVLKPSLDQVGLMLGDYMAVKRERMQRALDVGNRVLQSRQLDADEAGKTFDGDKFITILESASRTGDRDLSEMFGGLLASTIDPESSGKTHGSFAKTVEQLSPLDARILRRQMQHIRDIECGGMPEPEKYPTDRLYRFVTLSRDEFSSLGVVAALSLSFENILRLGLCKDAIVNPPSVMLISEYGYHLLDACLPKELLPPRENAATYLRENGRVMRFDD